MVKGIYPVICLQSTNFADGPASIAFNFSVQPTIHHMLNIDQVYVFPKDKTHKLFVATMFRNWWMNSVIVNLMFIYQLLPNDTPQKVPLYNLLQSLVLLNHAEFKTAVNTLVVPMDKVPAEGAQLLVVPDAPQPQKDIFSMPNVKKCVAALFLFRKVKTDQRMLLGLSKSWLTTTSTLRNSFEYVNDQIALASYRNDVFDKLKERNNAEEGARVVENQDDVEDKEVEVEPENELENEQENEPENEPENKPVDKDEKNDDKGDKLKKQIINKLIAISKHIADVKSTDYDDHDHDYDNHLRIISQLYNIKYDNEGNVIKPDDENVDGKGVGVEAILPVKNKKRDRLTWLRKIYGPKYTNEYLRTVARRIASQRKRHRKNNAQNNQRRVVVDNDGKEGDNGEDEPQDNNQVENEKFQKALEAAANLFNDKENKKDKKKRKEIEGDQGEKQDKGNQQNQGEAA